MDKISRRHPQFDRTLLRLQFARQGLKCHELLVQDTRSSSVLVRRSISLAPAKMLPSKEPLSTLKAW
jgi:hypothetical protein